MQPYLKLDFAPKFVWITTVVLLKTKIEFDLWSFAVIAAIICLFLKNRVSIT